MNEIKLKVLIYLSLLLLGCQSNLARNDNLQNDDLVVLRTHYSVPGCGVIAFAAAYSFTIDKSDSSFIGIIRCPDMYGKDFFRAGKKYKIKTTSISIYDSLIHYTVTNPFENENHPTFLITQIEYDDSNNYK